MLMDNILKNIKDNDININNIPAYLNSKQFSEKA